MQRFFSFIKCLGIDLALFSIIFTFTFYTYPNITLANETGTGVYQPGSEFNDALAKTNESAEGTGLMGMVEQFVALGFAAAAISSLKFKHTDRSTADCPQNKNANITLRLLQAGGLAYLLGEIKAKAEFKKASQLATDSAFAPKAKEDESTAAGQESNQKQVEAYETLIKVYDHKIKGIETKKKLATLAELAYIGALGIEMVKTKNLKQICVDGRREYEPRKEQHIANVQAFLGRVTAEKNNYRATQKCDVPPATPIQPGMIPCESFSPYVACQMTEPNIELMITNENLEKENRAIGGRTAALQGAAQEGRDGQTVSKGFFSLKNVMIMLAVGSMIKSVNYNPEKTIKSKNIVQSNFDKREITWKDVATAIVRNFIYVSNANANGAGVPAVIPPGGTPGVPAVITPGSSVPAPLGNSLPVSGTTGIPGGRDLPPGWERGDFSRGAPGSTTIDMDAEDADFTDSNDRTRSGGSRGGDLPSNRAPTVRPPNGATSPSLLSRFSFLSSRGAALRIGARVAAGLVSGPVGWTLLAGSLLWEGYNLYQTHQQREADEAARLAEQAEQQLQEENQRALDQIAYRERNQQEIDAMRSDPKTCYAGCQTCTSFDSEIVEAKAKLEGEDGIPIMCCGSEIVRETPTGASDNIPNPGIVDKKQDVEFQKLPLIGSAGDRDIMNFIKPGIINAIEAKYFASYEAKGKKPAQILSEHRAFYQYLEHLEENFDSEFEKSIETKKFNQTLASIDLSNESEYENLLKKLTNNLIIDDANALDFSGLLGFGIKLFLVYKLTANFFRTKALTSPKTRMWTYGVIAAINAVIIIFQGKRLKDNEKQRDIIKAELEKFKNSNAIGTGLDTGGNDDDDDDNGNERDNVATSNTSLGGGGFATAPGTIACAARSTGGNRFSPVPCPARPIRDISRRRGRDLNNREVNTSPLLSTVPNLVSDATSAAASGLDQTDPKAFNATLDGATRQLNAVKKEVDRVAKELDKTDPLVLKDDKGRPVLAGSIVRSLAAIRKANRGDSAQSVQDSALTSSAKESLGKILEEADKKGQATGSTSSGFNPNAGGGYNYGGGSYAAPSNGGVIDNFDQYQGDLDYAGQREDLNYAKGEIIDNENVSIFKVLNNRYLKNYEKLLGVAPNRVFDDELEEAKAPSETP